MAGDWQIGVCGVNSDDPGAPREVPRRHDQASHSSSFHVLPLGVLPLLVEPPATLAEPFAVAVGAQ